MIVIGITTSTEVCLNLTNRLSATSSFTWVLNDKQTFNSYQFSYPDISNVIYYSLFNFNNSTLGLPPSQYNYILYETSVANDLTTMLDVVHNGLLTISATYTPPITYNSNDGLTFSSYTNLNR